MNIIIILIIIVNTLINLLTFATVDTIRQKMNIKDTEIFYEEDDEE